MKGKTVLTTVLTGAVAVLVGWTAVNSSRRSAQYVILDLGVPDGYHVTEARAVTDSGAVVGTSSGGRSRGFGGFLYHLGKYHTVTPQDRRGSATGVNDHLQVVGEVDLKHTIPPPRSVESVPWEPHAFLWADGKLQDLGTMGGASSAAGINAEGEVVGYSFLANGRLQAFSWKAGRMHPLPMGNYTSTRAYAINDQGVIVGEGTLQDLASGHAILWDHGRVTDLGTLGGKESTATAISRSGLVAGWSDTRFSSRGFVWTRGRMRRLGQLRPWGHSAAYAINDAGVVVGDAHISLDPWYGMPVACAWVDGRCYDLNSLIDRPKEWILYSAYGINNWGQIVGVGAKLGEANHAYLLTPVERSNGRQAG